MSRSFQRKTDAERWRRAELRAIDNGRWVDPAKARRPFGDYAEGWLASKNRIKPKTRKGYRSILNARILPTFSDVPIGRISRQSVTDWVAGLQDRGLSPSSIRQAHQCLNAILEQQRSTEWWDGTRPSESRFPEPRSRTDVF